eukprot:Pompholyxophrys_punicea_v1_NODE_115_length_3387_cov_15.520108.p3 type:complete len:110 gc:universal NODE_115_length_3387_cov_15.520108:1809-1480(-)
MITTNHGIPQGSTLSTTLFQYSIFPSYADDNPNKTTYTLFYPTHTEPRIDNHTIAHKTSIKVLGLHIHQSLKYHDHIHEGPKRTRRLKDLVHFCCLAAVKFKFRTVAKA